MKEDEESIVCMDVFEYADKVEEMGKEYDGAVEVMWSSDDSVTPEQIYGVGILFFYYTKEINGYPHFLNYFTLFVNPPYILFRYNLSISSTRVNDVWNI